MGISVQEVGGVYYLSGELDWAGVGDLRNAMKPVPKSSRELVIDLAEVSFIDSMGVRALVLLSKGWGGLVLRYPQDALVRVFGLLQIDEVPGIRIELD